MPGGRVGAARLPRYILRLQLREGQTGKTVARPRWWSAGRCCGPDGRDAMMDEHLPIIRRSERAPVRVPAGLGRRWEDEDEADDRDARGKGSAFRGIRKAADKNTQDRRLAAEGKTDAAQLLEAAETSRRTSPRTWTPARRARGRWQGRRCLRGRRRRQGPYPRPAAAALQGRAGKRRAATRTTGRRGRSTRTTTMAGATASAAPR
ncbi:MAG: hypothetical protein HS111_23705 [Kofleriaceae bacterium]|nr:hypothetical protein [Kofleriaceae bacterium]